MATYGQTTTNANKNPVLNQLIAPSLTPKYCDAVVDIAEKVNHCQAGQICYLQRSKTVATMVISSTHIPAHDDVKQRQLEEAKPPSLVHSVSASGIRHVRFSSFWRVANKAVLRAAAWVARGLPCGRGVNRLERAVLVANAVGHLHECSWERGRRAVTCGWRYGRGLSQRRCLWWISDKESRWLFLKGGTGPECTCGESEVPLGLLYRTSFLAISERRTIARQRLSSTANKSRN